MQQFNPWFFGNNQQQEWPFQGFYQTMPGFGQFTANGFNNNTYNGWQQAWQQQFQPNMAGINSFNIFDIGAFNKPLLQNNEAFAKATMAMLTKLGDCQNNEEITAVALDYAKQILQINWHSTTGMSDFATTKASFAITRNSLQWAIDNFASLPNANSKELNQYQNSLHIWVDFYDAATAMTILYDSFSNETTTSFAKALAENLEESDNELKDAKKILDFFISHYETAFTKWLQSKEYSSIYGKLINASSAVRADQQIYIDKFVENLGLPSKQEMDTTHKRAHNQSNRIRQLENQINSLENKAKNQDLELEKMKSKLTKNDENQQQLTDKLKANNYQIGEMDAKINQQDKLITEQRTIIKEIQQANKASSTKKADMTKVNKQKTGTKKASIEPDQPTKTKT